MNVHQSFRPAESKQKDRAMVIRMAHHMAERQHPQTATIASKWYRADAERALEALLIPTEQMKARIRFHTDPVSAYLAGVRAALEGW